MQAQGRKKRKRGPLVFQLISKLRVHICLAPFLGFHPKRSVLAPLFYSRTPTPGVLSPLASGLPFLLILPFSGLKAPGSGPGAQRVVILDVRVPLRKTPPDSQVLGLEVLHAVSAA